MTTTTEFLTTAPTCQLESRAMYLRALSSDFSEPAAVAIRRRACELEFIAFVRDLQSVSSPVQRAAASTAA